MLILHYFAGFPVIIYSFLHHHLPPCWNSMCSVKKKPDGPTSGTITRFEAHALKIYGRSAVQQSFTVDVCINSLYLFGSEEEDR